MKNRRVMGEKSGYWNIKGCGDATRFFLGNCLFYRGNACGDFWWKCGTSVPPVKIVKMAKIYDKT
jgi:hypothetical protein